jgi:aspartate aminotransferase
LRQLLSPERTMTSTRASLTQFARGLKTEGAFDVLAVARKLKAQGKDVIELQIGDSPFSSTRSALAAGVRAIQEGQTHYGPSPGLPSFRQTIAETVRSEFGIQVGPENVIVGPGAKIFEQLFCECFLERGDAVLLFSPAFPTYIPNLQRRGAEPYLVPLRAEQEFRPDVGEVERFVKSHPHARAIILNSPHNPTGGVATPEDLAAIADVIRGRNIAVFSDEPYCHMVWRGKHTSLLTQPGMLGQCVAAYTFSKSYSMSGWRLGYALADTPVIEAMGKMINTTLSCTPPFVQLAGEAALKHDSGERDEVMGRFRRKVELLVAELRKVPGVKVLEPAATFYVFPDVSAICQKLSLTSHGLALYLLEGADERKGVACLGGECFGEAGQGFLRFSCAEPDDRLIEAVHFLAEAVTRTDRVQAYRTSHPERCLPA